MGKEHKARTEIRKLNEIYRKSVPMRVFKLVAGFIVGATALIWLPVVLAYEGYTKNKWPFET